MSCFGMGNGSSAGWPLSPSPSPSRSSSRRRRGVKPWRFWWRRCAGLATAIQSKIRRRAVRWPMQGARRSRSSVSVSSSSMREGWCHHRSFAPVYVDELYSHPKTLHVAVHEASSQQYQPSTGAGKVAARPDAANNAAATNAGASGKARAVAANNVAATNASATFADKNAAATNAGASAKARAVAANNAAATNASATFAAKNAAADAATNAGARGKGRAAGGKKAAAAAATNNGGGKARGGVRSLLMSPLRGVGGMCEVDVRAEVFIRKFREEMRLQNQKSAEEFHAMLARGL